MDHESQIIITTNEIQEGTPGEFLLRVRGISTALRRFRNGEVNGADDHVTTASTVLFDDLAVELTSPSQQEFTLQLQRANTDIVTTISYSGSSLFVQRSEDEAPQQMTPDAEGFGVVQFVNTVIDQLYKDTHPDDDVIW